MATKFGKYYIIVCGSRWYNDYKTFRALLAKALSSLPKDKIVILSGVEDGPASMALTFSKQNNISVRRYIPFWETYGNKATVVRNEEMSELATHVIAFWDYQSIETAHILKLAKERELEVRIIDLRKILKEEK